VNAPSVVAKCKAINGNGHHANNHEFPIHLPTRPVIQLPNFIAPIINNRFVVGDLVLFRRAVQADCLITRTDNVAAVARGHLVKLDLSNCNAAYCRDCQSSKDDQDSVFVHRFTYVFLKNN